MKKNEKSAELIKKLNEVLQMDIGFKKKKNKLKFEVYEVFIFLFITAVSGLIGGMLLGQVIEPEKKVDSESKYSAELNDFLENYEYIKNNFYGEFDEDEILEAALDSVLDSTGDPYSDFMNEADTEAFNFALDGSFEGLGVRIAKNASNELEILEVFSDSPAGRAGLKVGENIVSINGTPTAEKTSSEFVEIVKNSTEKNIELVINDGSKDRNVTVVKGLVEIPSVYSEMLNDKTGYLDIDIFALNTASQFKTELNKLESKNIETLIIDLRDNTGGHLSVVSNMLSELFDSSYVIYEKENKDGRTKVYSTGTKTVEYKIILLQNANSASASEIMIGAIKDNLGAKSVGIKSFGKGTVQEVKVLPDGSQIKLTIEKWLTPNGAWIHEAGIEPDFEIEQSMEYYTNPSKETDQQLKKALELINE